MRHNLLKLFNFGVKKSTYLNACKGHIGRVLKNFTSIFQNISLSAYKNIYMGLALLFKQINYYNSLEQIKFPKTN